MEKELQLQPRLQCIASLVPQGARLADVGTDHGYLPVWLLQHGRIESAIASDINALPLDHARATAREYGVTERMDFRLCPGLAKIKAEECDAIAIAGMGGETILGIRPGRMRMCIRSFCSRRQRSTFCAAGSAGTATAF